MSKFDDLIVKSYADLKSMGAVAKLHGIGVNRVTEILNSRGVKRSKGRLRKVTLNEFAVVKLYDKIGDSKKVAKHFGSSCGTVLRILKNQGRVFSKGPRITSASVESLILQEYAKGKSQPEIAKLVNMSQQGVSKVLVRNNVGSRKYKNNTANLTVFDSIDSEEKAYWLGFLAADGYIAKPNVLGLVLHERDKQHVVSFAKFIGAKVKLSKNRAEAGVSFRSIQLVNRLQTLGFTFNKSLDFDPSICLNSMHSDLHKHFWRGMVDGDGSLAKKGYAHMTLVGTFESVNLFKLFLEFNDIVCDKNASDKDSYFAISCWGLQAAKAMSLLYEGSTVFLERKQHIAFNKMLSISHEGIVNIGQREAKFFLQKNHYLRTLPIASVCFGWYSSGVLIGVAAFGNPVSPGTQAHFKDKTVIELRRFCLLNNEKNLASKFLSACVRQIKLLNKYDLLVTYSDRAQGHEGIMYKAIGMSLDGGSSDLQLVGVVGNRRLTGVHLQKRIAQYGIKNISFQESPGKLRYVLKLI